MFLSLFPLCDPFSLSPMWSFLSFPYVILSLFSYLFLSLFPLCDPFSLLVFFPFFFFSYVFLSLFPLCVLSLCFFLSFSNFFLSLFSLCVLFSLIPTCSFLSFPTVFLSLFLLLFPFSLSPMCSFLSFSYFSFLSLHLYQKIKLFLNFNILSLNLKYIISWPEPGLLFFDLGNNNKNNYTFRKSVS